MQLILETETPSVIINEKMSAHNEESLNEATLPNGDIKDILEVNRKSETNGTGNKENIQNKENIPSKTDETEYHKESEDTVSTVKQVEEVIPIQESFLSTEHKPESSKSDDIKNSINDKRDVNELDQLDKPEIVMTEKHELDETVKQNTTITEETLVSPNIIKDTAEKNYTTNEENKTNPLINTTEESAGGNELVGFTDDSVEAKKDDTSIKPNLEMEDSFENDINLSISNMVDDIVDKLDSGDNENNFMVQNEIDNEVPVEKKSSTEVENDKTKESTEETRTFVQDNTEVQETIPDTKSSTNAEEQQSKMDVDDELEFDSTTERPNNSDDKEPISTEKEDTSCPMNIDATEDSSENVDDPVFSENENVIQSQMNCAIESEMSLEEQSVDDNTAEETIVAETEKTYTEKDDVKPRKQCNINSVDDKTAQNNVVAETEKTDIEKDHVKPMETKFKEVIKLKSSDTSPSYIEDGDKIDDEHFSLATSNIEETDDNVSDSNVEKVKADDNAPVSVDKNDNVNNTGVSQTEHEVTLIDDTEKSLKQQVQNENTPEKAAAERNSTPLFKLSNTMDILSDEEDEAPLKEKPKDDLQNQVNETSEKQCINLDDDDDIMLIDEEKHDTKETPLANTNFLEVPVNSMDELQSKSDSDKFNDEAKVINPVVAENKSLKENETETDRDAKPEPEIKEVSPIQPETEDTVEPVKPEKPKPLIPDDFFKTYRKNLTDMTRDDLEEFCILKIVESIIDRSSLNEIRSKLKTMVQTTEEYKKKAMMLTKQNRDLQVVLKSVQEEQKKSTGNQPITPLKITRSVGMQVLMTDKNRRRIAPGPNTATNANVNNKINQNNNRNVRNPSQSPRNTPQKVANNQAIPVPRLVPAGMTVTNKTINVPQTLSSVSKATAVENGAKNTIPAQKPEKRTHSRMQSQASSVTVDLTDDEPPSKVTATKPPAPPVRLVNPQNLLAPRQQFTQQVNSPRKVYIPISINGNQPQSVRPGQTLMLKTVTQGPRPRGPASTVVRPPQNVQVRRVGARHPAPLPDAMKQYQPPNWKALPPAPDLKLSKVENGIVISWKIEGYQEDSYEEIASYQLYAYQETSAPPSTALWKKIGDVKALPLPMACTLTQFMAGYKYYFAVRAVDIRSRLGPFSLPGSILLLNKM